LLGLPGQADHWRADRYGDAVEYHNPLPAAKAAGGAAACCARTSALAVSSPTANPKAGQNVERGIF
jgi:hypothetical protein